MRCEVRPSRTRLGGVAHSDSVAFRGLCFTDGGTQMIAGSSCLELGNYGVYCEARPSEAVESLSPTKFQGTFPWNCRRELEVTLAPQSNCCLMQYSHVLPMPSYC
jgi:hypothetical protein